MSTVSIYHHPACGTSRTTLAKRHRRARGNRQQAPFASHMPWLYSAGQAQKKA